MRKPLIIMMTIPASLWVACSSESPNATQAQVPRSSSDDSSAPAMLNSNSAATNSPSQSAQGGGCQTDSATSLPAPGATAPYGKVIGYPLDANVIDVKVAYGVKGDGCTDDTENILKALRDHSGIGSGDDGKGRYFAAHTLYFPPGTYIVSDTLYPERVVPDPGAPGKMIRQDACAIRLLGAGKDRTIIKLKDGSPGFQSAKKYVIQTGNCKGNPSTDDSGFGSNAGFGNYIEHLTVDTGANPGAVGIRYDVANSGAMQDVRVKSNGFGHTGLWFDSIVGPGYVHRVEVDGFQVGVHFDDAPVNNIVIDDLRIANARRYGIENGGKNIQIRGLTTSNTPVALRSHKAHAATVLIDAVLEGTALTAGAAAISIDNDGFFFGRNITTTAFGCVINSSSQTRDAGYSDCVGDSSSKVVVGRIPAGMTSRLVREWSSIRARRGGVYFPYDEYGGFVRSMNLPIKTAPHATLSETPPFSQWVNVKTYGAKGDGITDDTPAFQQAVDSGGEVVYFPFGTYRINGRVIVTRNVRRVDFLFSRLIGPGEIFVNGSRVASDYQHVTLENLVGVGDAGSAANGDRRFRITHNSNKSVILKNVTADLISVAANASGDLFLENIGVQTVVEIDHVDAWIRQINRETVGGANHGGKLWVLGDNLEGKDFRGRWDYPMQPSLATTGGGQTEILGGAIDPMPYYAADLSEVGPVYSAVTTAQEPLPSRLSVVSAGLAVQARVRVSYYDRASKRLVWEIKPVPDADGQVVFGRWPRLISDLSGLRTNQFHILDSYGIHLLRNTSQQRVFVPLYVSPCVGLDLSSASGLQLCK